MRELLELIEESSRLESLGDAVKVDRDFYVGYAEGAIQALLWMRGKNGPAIAAPPSAVLKERYTKKPHGDLK